MHNTEEYNIMDGVRIDIKTAQSVFALKFLPSITDISFGTKSSLMVSQAARTVEFLIFLFFLLLIPNCTTEHSNISSVVRSISECLSASIVHVVIDSTASRVLFLDRFTALLLVVCTVGILLGNLVEFLESVDSAFVVPKGTFLVKLGTQKANVLFW